MATDVACLFNMIQDSDFFKPHYQCKTYWEFMFFNISWHKTLWISDILVLNPCLHVSISVKTLQGEATFHIKKKSDGSSCHTLSDKLKIDSSIIWKNLSISIKLFAILKTRYGNDKCLLPFFHFPFHFKTGVHKTKSVDDKHHFFDRIIITMT